MPIQVFSRPERHASARNPLTAGAWGAGYADSAGTGDCQSDREAAGPLRGYRVLIAEDNSLIALDLEEMVAAAGAEVVGPVGQSHQALAILRAERVDAALVSVQLADGCSGYLVADALAARLIPFAFATGYDTAHIDARYRRVPVIEKPCDAGQVRRTLLALLGPISRDF